MKLEYGRKKRIENKGDNISDLEWMRKSEQKGFNSIYSNLPSSSQSNDREDKLAELASVRELLESLGIEEDANIEKSKAEIEGAGDRERAEMIEEVNTLLGWSPESIVGSGPIPSSSQNNDREATDTDIEFEGSLQELKKRHFSYSNARKAELADLGTGKADDEVAIPQYDENREKSGAEIVASIEALFRDSSESPEESGKVADTDIEFERLLQEVENRQKIWVEANAKKRGLERELETIRQNNRANVNDKQFGD